MEWATEPYEEQHARWPESGRHILAQFDQRSVVVYQAYRPAIARFAVEHQRFGGEFSFSRMSWIKPNFLWMMYRCGWGSKADQEAVLAVRLHRWAFDEILKGAVHSAFVAEIYGEHEQWKEAVARSDVRLQWDPDHDPSGHALERRAIQLGMRGQPLKKYASEWIIEVSDISGFVREQAQHAMKHEWSKLLTPRERVYPVSDGETAKKLELNHDG